MRPLENIRVLDLTMFWAGPSATYVLGALGAQIIKVEAIQRPDGFRMMGVRDKPKWWEMGAGFNQANVNKYGITLDLTTEEGKDIAKELVKISDIVMDSYSARVMNNLGLGYSQLQELNPSIVMLSMPGFGQTGPWKNTAAFALNLEQSAGIAYITGYENDVPNTVRASDPIQGYYGSSAAMLALYHRMTTGTGQFIDYAQLETLAHMIGPEVISYSMTGEDSVRKGNRDLKHAPQGCYRCKGQDEWIVITIQSDEEWVEFAEKIGHSEWSDNAKFTTSQLRMKNQDSLDKMIESWTISKDKHDAMEILQSAGIAAGPVFNEKEIIENKHLHSRNWFQAIERDVIGTKRHPKPAMHLSKAKINYDRPAPTLGQHNELVLSTFLGISDSAIRSMRERNIIGTEPLN